MGQATMEKPKRTPAATKLVTIAFVDEMPNFSFKGAWTGKDVRKVLTGITRQYRLYQRSVRRDVPVKPILTILKKEETNG